MGSFSLKSIFLLCYQNKEKRAQGTSFANDVPGRSLRLHALDQHQVPQGLVPAVGVVQELAVGTGVRGGVDLVPLDLVAGHTMLRELGGDEFNQADLALVVIGNDDMEAIVVLALQEPDEGLVGRMVDVRLLGSIRADDRRGRRVREAVGADAGCEEDLQPGQIRPHVDHVADPRVDDGREHTRQLAVECIAIDERVTPAVHRDDAPGRWVEEDRCQAVGRREGVSVTVVGQNHAVGVQAAEETRKPLAGEHVGRHEDGVERRLGHQGASHAVVPHDESEVERDAGVPGLDRLPGLTREVPVPSGAVNGDFDTALKEPTLVNRTLHGSSWLHESELDSMVNNSRKSPLSQGTSFANYVPRSFRFLAKSSMFPAP